MYECKKHQNLIEYPIEAISYLKKIAKILKKKSGGILIIDYGYTIKKKKQTLQGIYKHSFSNIFKNIGKTDISSYVDFNLLKDFLKKNNLITSKIVDQGKFLKSLGILERANILSKNMTFKEKANLYYRLKKLLDEKEMGKIFKVLFAQKNNKKFLLGF